MSIASNQKDISSSNDSLDKNRDDCLDKFKLKVFTVYAKLVNNRKCGPIFASLLQIVSALQITDYIFEMHRNNLSNDSIFNFIFSITAWFRIGPIFQRNDVTDGVMFLGIALSFIGLMYAVIIIYYIISCNKEKFKMKYWISSLLGTISFWLIFVLVSPASDVLFALIICNGKAQTMDYDISCWNSEHITMLSVFAPFLIIMILCAIVASIFFNEFMILVNDYLSRFNSFWLETRILLFKLLLSFISQFWDYQDWNLTAIPLILAGLLLSYFLYLAFTRFPYYKPIIYYIYTSGIAINFMFCLIFIVEMMLDQHTSGIIILASAVFVPLVVIQHRKNVIYLLIHDLKIDQIETESLIVLYSNTCYKYMKEKESNYGKKVAIAGLSSIHLYECFNPDCPMRGEKVRQNDSYNHVISSTIGLYIKKVGATPNIFLYYSGFLIDVMKNIYDGEAKILKAENSSPNVQEEYFIFRMKQYAISQVKKAQLALNAIGAESIDVRVAIKFDNLINNLETQIEEISNQYVEFWSSLEAITPDLNLVHTKGVEIMKLGILIDEIWQEIIGISHSNHRINAIYGKYVQVLKNDKEEGNLLLNGVKYNEPSPVEKSNAFGNDSIVFAEDTGIIIAKSTGIILKHNVGITKFFSYNSAELIGQNVQMLMPRIIGKNHAKLIETVISSGNEGKLNEAFMTLALHRFGNIFAITILVKPVPSLDNGIEFISFIRKCEKDACLILTNEHGKLEGFSSNFGELLEMIPSQLNSHEIYLQIFCPALADLIVNDDDEKSTYLDTLSQLNRPEGTPIELTITMTKEHRDLLPRLQSKGKSKNTNNKTTYDIMTEYCKSIHEILNYKNPDTRNLIERVIPQDHTDIKKTLKGRYWFNDYGNGLIKLRLFKMKSAKSWKRIVERSGSRVANSINSDKKSLTDSHNKELKPMRISILPETSQRDSREGESQDPGDPEVKNSCESNIDISSSNSDCNNNQNEGFIQKMMKENLMDKNQKKDSINDDTSSTINSSTFSFGRQIQMMRNSVRHKVTPKSIRNLKLVAFGIFGGIITLAIIILIVLLDTFHDFKSDILMYNYAEFLDNKIITITSRARLLLSDIYQEESSPYDNVVEHFQSSISEYAKGIQTALNRLEDLDHKVIYASDTIELNYDNSLGFMSSYNIKSGLAIMSFVIHSMNIASKTTDEFTMDDTSFSFVTLNGFNSIIVSVYDMLDRITEMILDDESYDVKIMIVLLSIGSAVLVLGFCLLIPVIISVGKNREEIVLMFTVIPLVKIKEEVEKCRQYCNQLHCGEDQTALIIPGKLPIKEGSNAPVDNTNDQEQHNDQEDAPLNSSRDDNTDSYYVPKKHVVHTRRYIHFNNPIIRTIVILSFVILILESYFLTVYFQPSIELSNLVSLTKEQSYGYFLRLYNSFAFHAVQFGMACDFKERIINEGLDYVVSYVDALIDIESRYYNQHNLNTKKHDSSYDSLYYTIVSNTICDIANCSISMYELPEKGLHQLNVAFWEMLRQTLTDYTSGVPASKTLNDARMNNCEVMLEKFIYIADEKLLVELEASMSNKIKREKNIIIVLFVAYMAIVIIIFIIWRYFISGMNDKLNYTRTILGLIPPDVIRENKKIRDYIISTSKLIFASSNS